ncbi:hypothetical protein OG203_17075 [Nocardia sp. NBC_01499]|uniref:hypothetical protein n=1 Tax=Nocardia sp. NBC_01499 TaxID=2903597 RepID=UPI003868B987
MTATQYEELMLPVSGLQVHWRAGDEHFRIRSPASDARMSSDQLPWRPWSGHNMAVGTSGPIVGEPAAMWWAVWGEYTGADVQVTLDDRSHPAVIVFHKLWMTEWRGRAQAATVITAGQQADVQFATPFGPTAGRTIDGARKWHNVETPSGFHDIPRNRIR